jgi:hypothetical protein
MRVLLTFLGYVCAWMPVILLKGDATQVQRESVWEPQKIEHFLEKAGNRIYFSRLFKYGGFRKGLEMGTDTNRFSEAFLVDNPDTITEWHMVEPFPGADFYKRKNSWAERGIGNNTRIIHHQKKSLDPSLLNSLQDHSFDFIYIDGVHDYTTVRQELPLYWEKLKVGGLFSGHDYADHGETKTLDCRGCKKVPRSEKYTDYGKSNMGKPNHIAFSQTMVVQAVQEFVTPLQAAGHAGDLHHTDEHFTRESLAQHGFDFDIVISGDRNPSWYFVKLNGK